MGELLHSLHSSMKQNLSGRRKASWCGFYILGDKHSSSFCRPKPHIWANGLRGPQKTLSHLPTVQQDVRGDRNACRSLDSKEIMHCYASNTDDHSSGQAGTERSWKGGTVQRAVPFWGQISCCVVTTQHTAQVQKQGQTVTISLERTMDHQGLQTSPNSFWELFIRKLCVLHSVASDSKNPLPGRDLGAPLLT